MPSPAPFSSPQNNLAFPALYLYPLNDSFIPKHISLTPSGQRVKIGRQTNAKTSPGERNGYFDSKVLSRQHAEVWEENGKRGQRRIRYRHCRRRQQDHNPPQGRRACIMYLQRAAGSRRTAAESGAILAVLHDTASRPSRLVVLQLRPPVDLKSKASADHQCPIPVLTEWAVWGASMRAPGKSGLTFDHILSRLQGELAKSRETGQDLQTLSGAINEIQDTLGGSLPSNLPPYPHVLPPVRPPQPELPPPSSASPPQLHPPAPESTANASAVLLDLQSQLQTTQSSLASHVEKIRELEGVFAEQEAIKQELRTLRDLVGVLRQGSTSRDQPEPKGGFDIEDDDGEVDDDESDTHSIATVIPHALERVDEEDEEEEEGVVDDKQDEGPFRSSSPDHQDIFQEQDEDREQRRAELGRPRTPEPTNMGMNRNLARSSTLRSPLSISTEAPVVSPPGPTIDELTNRLATLSTQLESALAMSSTLQAQHAAAQGTIVALEEKVKRLEGLVSDVVSSAPPSKAADTKNGAESPSTAESVTPALLSFKNSLQSQWTSIQEEWAQERDHLKRTRDDWEAQMRGMVDERIKAKFTHSAFAPTSMSYPHGNGGLATPPSPRSLSADSAHGSSGGRRRRKRSTSRGRSSSPKGVNGSAHGSSAPGSPVSDDAITELALRNGRVLPTPESSVHASSLSSFDGRSLGPGFASDPVPTSPPAEAEKSLRAMNGQIKHGENNTAMHIQTAIGVLVLSVAAAAVIWRVKPE
ncbi:Glycosyltransferase family 69 protein [Mycena sanguinolenta]|uniref:Glycosyltransferase family 69 protein n=1 Tax=Mycena sanguinolenta TaxID=230812 RepID=A0A8H6YN13_9AGAR|nr:Glycosyltransferase family 69 protein [Mycena sanguinolenta]